MKDYIAGFSFLPKFDFQLDGQEEVMKKELTELSFRFCVKHNVSTSSSLTGVTWAEGAAETVYPRDTLVPKDSRMLVPHGQGWWVGHLALCMWNWRCGTRTLGRKLKQRCLKDVWPPAITEWKNQNVEKYGHWGDKVELITEEQPLVRPLCLCSQA